MHRIDTPTAQVDKFGVGKNGFTAGNPQTGELPTALDQDFFDSVQEEISAVIEGASIPLNKASRNQLLTALKKTFLQAGNNLSEISSAGALAQAAAKSNIGLSGVDTPVSTVANATSALKSPNRLVNVFVRNNKDWGAYDETGNAYIPLPLERGGLGATTKAGGRAALDLLSAALRDVGVGENQIPDMSSFASLLSLNGYCKLPNGWIIQVAQVNIVGGSGPVITTFPITFPSSCVFVTAGAITESTTFLYMNQVSFYSNSSATVNQYGATAGSAFAPRNDFNTHVFAMGY